MTTTKDIYSVFKDTMSGLEKGLQVIHITTPTSELLYCQHDDEAMKVLQDPKTAPFDQIPVKRGEAFIGLLNRSDYSNGTTGLAEKRMRPLGEDTLISADTPLLEFINDKNKSLDRLVIHGTQIYGLVTRSDILKLPVKLLTFALVTYIEAQLLEHIRSTEVEQDECLSWIDKNHKDTIKKKYKERVQNGSDIDKIELTFLSDKIAIVKKLSESGQYASLLPPKELRDQLPEIQQLRNAVAHNDNYDDDISLQGFINRLQLANNWIIEYEKWKENQFVNIYFNKQIPYTTIQWHYNLLEKEMQCFFRQLSIFINGATIEAIESTCATRNQGTFDVHSHITSLIARNLLEQVDYKDSEPRFRLLETCREYGLFCLEQLNEREEAQRAHAMYYLELLERVEKFLKGPQLAIWLTILDRENENLCVALDWLVKRQETELALRFCEVFGKFYGLRGYWSEEEQWLKVVLELPYQPTQKMLRARVLRRAGHLSYRLRKLTSARNFQEESVQIARELDDKKTLVGALVGLGQTLYRQNEVTAAGQALQEGVVVARILGDKWVLVNSLESLGRFMYNRGNTFEARRLLKECEALSKETDKESLIRILMALIDVEISDGNNERARADAQKSFVLAQELGTKPLIALTLGVKGKVALSNGDYVQAVELYEEQIAISQALRDDPTIAAIKIILGDIALVRGDIEKATLLVEDAFLFFKKQGDNPNIAASLDILAGIRRIQGDLIQAIAFYKEALVIDQEYDKRSIGKHLIGLAIVLLEQGLLEKSVNFFGAAGKLVNPKIDLHFARLIEYENSLSLAINLLPEDTFNTAFSQGAAMTFEQMLASL